MLIHRTVDVKAVLEELISLNSLTKDDFRALCE